jgi:hypothetical protein
MNPEELQGRPDDAIQAAADRRHLKPAAMRKHAMCMLSARAADLDPKTLLACANERGHHPPCFRGHRD